MRYRNDRFLGASSRRNPSVEVCQRALLHPYCCVRRLYQTAAQPRVASPNTRRASLAGTLVIAWTQLGPTRQMCSIAEALQVGSDFGYQLLRHPWSDARNAIPYRLRFCPRHWPFSRSWLLTRSLGTRLALRGWRDGRLGRVCSQRLCNRGVERADLLVQEVDLLQMLRDQEAMVLTHSPVQRLLQQSSLGAQATLRQFGHHLRIAL